MGRYYEGDINGKFMFGVQDSDAADRFGVVGTQPNYLMYYFETSDLPTVQEELKVIKENLGEHFDKIKELIENNLYYTTEEFAKYLGIDPNEAYDIIREYADYRLGKQIEERLLQGFDCEFSAEM